MLDLHWTMNEYTKKRDALGKMLLLRACMRSIGPLPEDAEVKVLVNGQEVPFGDVIGGLRDDIEELATVKAMHRIDCHQKQIEKIFEDGIQGCYERSLKEIGLKHDKHLFW